MPGFVDYVEELVDLKSNCSIKFKADNGAISIVSDRIKDVNIEEDQRYIKTAKGLKIDISQVIEINGRSAQNFC